MLLIHWMGWLASQLFRVFARPAKQLDNQKVKKILVLELWGLGDIVLVTPALIALRQSYPEARIVLLAKKRAMEILQHSSLVDEFITYDFPWTKFRGKYKFWQWDFRGLLKLINKLRKESFDLALDARGDFRNNLLSFLISSKRRIGYDWTRGGYFLTDVVSLGYEGLHRVDAWLNLLKYLGTGTDSVAPRLYLSENEDKWAEDFLADNAITPDDLVIGIHPGGRIKKRCWPLDRFDKVANYIKDKYNAKIIVFIEPDGYGGALVMNEHFIRAKLSLRELISVFSKLTILVCNDSGPMHIATAVDTPVVAIFGPTNPVWFGPYGDKHTVVIQGNIECRPCYDYCKYKEPLCLTSITVEDVLNQVDATLKEFACQKADI